MAKKEDRQRLFGAILTVGLATITGGATIAAGFATQGAFASATAFLNFAGKVALGYFIQL